MSNFKAWATDVALRAVKTAAQAAVALVTANTAGLTHLDFAVVADVAALAAFVCVLQNLSNLKVPDPVTTALTVVNNAVHDVTSSVDATGHVRLDFADGKAMFWDDAAASFKWSAPNASTPEQLDADAAARAFAKDPSTPVTPPVV